MPKCLLKYQWVKLPRAHLPAGKGIMGYWAKLASRSAFRKGQAHYCSYTNDVMPGMWSGGMVGLKSILGVKSRSAAFEIMEELQRYGFLRYTLDARTKKLEYAITDWVVKCSGAECTGGAVYATEGYGFLCLPRSITQRLVEQDYLGNPYPHGRCRERRWHGHQHGRRIHRRCSGFVISGVCQSGSRTWQDDHRGRQE